MNPLFQLPSPLNAAFFGRLALLSLLVWLGSWSVPGRAQATRELRVVSTTAQPGQIVQLAVELNAQGDENALGFSLNFNPALLTYQQAALGNAASTATLLINSTAVASGRLGITLALPTDQRFAAGARQVAVVTFAVASVASDSTTISFGDDPIRREIADVNANSVTSTYTTGTLSFVQPNPVPALVSLNPATVTAGGAAFTLNVTGSNFVSGTTVRLNGNARGTTFVNAGQLQVLIPATDIASAGTASITALTPAPGGGVSNALSLTINPAVQNNPVPTLTSLEPNSRSAGSGAFTLFVNGTNFINASVVRWNGTERITNFVNANRLSINVAANDVAVAGNANVVVFNPAPGGGLSNQVSFTITPLNPLPTLTNLSPATATAGSNALTLTVNGTNFVTGATVRWNGANRPTTVVSATQVTAQILASDLLNPGTAAITVFNPEPGGGVSSALTFTINQPPNPVPVLSTLSPASATAGGAAFVLTVNGSSFVTNAVVRWNGAERLTNFVNSGQLTTQVSVADLANPGTVTLTVSNPASTGGGGGLSNAVNFTISPPPNPTPVLNSLNPNTVNAGSGSFTLTVNGSSFLSNSVVRWNGSDRPTTFVSATQLTAAIAAAEVASLGNVNVAVFTPASAGGGGGLSNLLGFAIGQPPNPVPALTSLAPNQAIANSGALTLTVNGNNFINGSQVRWNGADRVTTFVSASQLRAALNAADVASVGTATVTVFTAAPGGGTSNGLSFTINPPANPVPSLSALAPGSASAGGAAFTLTINGGNFINGAEVRWNGANRATTFVSAAQLTAQISASDVSAAGNATVTVFNPANVSGGGGLSNGLSFTINPAANPVPTLAGVTPNSALAGSGQITLAVNGASFVNGAVLRWNNLDRGTSFVSATQLTATILASDLVNAATAQLTVFNPANVTGGGGVSNALTFTINNPVPTLTSLAPMSTTVGGGAFTLTVNGTNFNRTSLIRWNGSERATTFVSATQLTAQIAAADIAALGTANVTVINPAPGGGSSSALTFAITQAANPVPVLTNLNPASTTAGSAAFSLVVNGSNFVTGAIVRWNGADRVTTFVSGQQVQAQITAADVATPATVSVTVFNPASATGGGGVSNALNFVVNQAANPVPVLSNLNPASATAGSAAFSLVVNGSNFVTGAIVRWNGADRATTFVSAQQVQAQITAADVAAPATVSVTVFNPASATGGGGVSNALTFTITGQPNPVPTLTLLNPASVTAGSAGLNLQISGTNFIPGSVIRWNQTNRLTNYVSATQLSTDLSASELANAGTVTVTVVNPAAPAGGGGTSNALPFTITPPVTVTPFASLSAASFDGRELARDSMVAGFGVNLATGIEIATTLPLPTNLLGTTITVRDSAGTELLAPLFFVAPTQVNYLLPANLAPGNATITVRSGDGKAATGTARIADIAPGIFAANSNGRGVPAGFAVRVKPDGSQVFEPLAVLNPATMQPVPTPVFLGPETDQVFLVLYGTGFRYRTTAANGLPNVTVTIGGVAVPVFYADRQPDFAGLDQLNLQLVRALVARNEVDLIVTVDGKVANTMRVNVR